MLSLFIIWLFVFVLTVAGIGTLAGYVAAKRKRYAKLKVIRNFYRPYGVK
jgi:hypothetical protein